MLARRRITLVLAAIATMACAIGGYALVGYVRTVGLPWDTSLNWQRMEGLVGTQVIASTAVRADIEPATGHMEGEATLQVTHPGGDGSEVVLLLNAGLNVDSLTCDGKSVSRRRQAERLLIQLPDGTGARQLKITYSGALTARNSAPLVTDEHELLVDKLHFWYPVDLKSFSDLSITVVLPEDFEVAWSGNLLVNQVENGRRTVRWEENRPLLAAGLVAGRYEKISRVQGSIRCNIYGRGLDAIGAESWLAALGDSYNYFYAQFGADGFSQINLVLSGAADGAVQLGGPLIICNPEVLAYDESAFALLAGQVARNWWGDTVSGRWFSSRPEAGEWLLTGLSEFSAWQALRTVNGRRAYLRYREELYSTPEIALPLKAYNLDRRLAPAPLDDVRALAVHGPFAAAMIAQYIGPDAFARACRNFMSVHRHTTVSHAALLHEMTLASEKPLDELVRAWFDRPGVFDYAVTGVAVDGGRAHVTIENLGDIPVFAPVELGVLTESGYQVHTIDAGVHGDTATVSIDGPLKRVILDPEFALGDLRRANNSWPATQWPAELAVSRNGRIALLSQSEWGDDSSRHVSVFSLAARTPEYAIGADERPLDLLQWSSDGQRLAVQTPDSAGFWQDKRWNVCGGPDCIFLGWMQNDPVYWRAGNISLSGESAETERGVLLPPPLPGLSAVHRVSGKVAYVTHESTLVVWDSATRAVTPIRDNVRPAGGIRWRGDSEELIYFQDDGALVSFSPESTLVETLLRRNYSIRQAKISDAGGRVAWVDPAGLLRALTPGDGEPVYISLPGEVVDFAWEGEDALVAIVAVIPRRLPMRFHADYMLWRIPASTWRGVQLPYDPMQFAAAESGVELLPRP